MRSVWVSMGCGCAMPGLARLAQDETLEKARKAQGATPGRRQPRQTEVGRYVERKAPALTRRLRKALRGVAKLVVERAAPLLRMQKDDTRRDTIEQILAELSSADLGLTIQGELVGPLLAAFKSAAAVGATQVGFDAKAIVEQVDPAAVAFAERRAGELITRINETTRDAVREVLTQAVDQGWSAGKLAGELDDHWAFGASRSETIARTELAFAHVHGNVAGWKATGEVIGKSWLLADTHPEPDECDDAAERGVIGLDEEFFAGVSQPPAHPNCVLPGTVVAPGGVIAAQFTRWFRGEVICIRTQAHEVTVTPNHPVLTQRGWVAAGRLQVGDSVLQSAHPATVSALVEPHDHNVPARIEEVAHALLMAGGVATRGMPVTAEAFHGDGVPDSEVDVVWAAGAFPGNVNAQAHEKTVQPEFGAGQLRGGGLSGDGAKALLGEGLLSATHGGMGGAGHRGALLGGHLGGGQLVAGAGVSHLQAEAPPAVAQRGTVAPDAPGDLDAGLAGHVPGVQRAPLGVPEPAARGVGFRPPTRGDASPLQQAIDRLLRDAQLPRKAERGFASLVSAAEVVELIVRQYEGPVHNLSTSFGWYFADGILVHNCLCDLKPHLRPLEG